MKKHEFLVRVMDSLVLHLNECLRSQQGPLLNSSDESNKGYLDCFSDVYKFLSEARDEYKEEEEEEDNDDTFDESTVAEINSFVHSSVPHFSGKDLKYLFSVEKLMEKNKEKILKEYQFIKETENNVSREPENDKNPFLSSDEKIKESKCCMDECEKIGGYPKTNYCNEHSSIDNVICCDGANCLTFIPLPPKNLCHHCQWEEDNKE